MKTNWTQAPWRWNSNSNQFNRDDKGEQYPLCHITANHDRDGIGDTIATVTTFFAAGGRKIPRAEWEANATLIIAAPDLFNACQMIRAIEESTKGRGMLDLSVVDLRDAYDCARKALNKAIKRQR